MPRRLRLALTSDPENVRARKTGAVGEERLGARLDAAANPLLHVLHDRRSKPLLRVLHDRRITGSRGNIDHLAVAATGVTVIDAKHHQG